jgi:enoyl-[acyl-carrier-protein] reductase (NADH)
MLGRAEAGMMDKMSIVPDAISQAALGAQVCQPEDMADVAVFLASSSAAGINGQNILVDKGLREAVHPMSGIWTVPEISPLD